MSAEAKQNTKNTLYYIHVVIFLLITFGFGFLPPFAQITEVGMRVLGAFIGIIYGWLFIGLDWPSLIALIALGLSGYASSVQELFVAGWSFYVIPQMILAYLFAEALAKTRFTSYISNKLMAIKIFQGRPYLLMFGCLIGAEVMFILKCGLAGLFLLWSMYSTMAQKAGYEKVNKFSMIIVPATLVVFILTNFLFPFNPGAVVQIGLFQQGMAAVTPGLEVSFLGWIAWWFLFTNIYIVVWVLFVKFVLRIKYPEIAAIGEELTAMGDAKQKMTFDQKFGLGMLTFFMAGMFIPSLLPKTWLITQIFTKIGLIGMLSLTLCIMCAFKKDDGKPFLSLQESAKGITWNVIWLLVATEPLATAFNSTECGIMPSVMAVVTPIITNMSPTLFVVVTLLTLGLITQVVHNFILMVVFIPLLCPLYAQMGGNPFVLFFGLVMVLNCALATPAASYTSAIMFGEPSLGKKQAYIQGFTHFALALIVFLLIGMPLASLILPY